MPGEYVSVLFWVECCSSAEKLVYSLSDLSKIAENLFFAFQFLAKKIIKETKNSPAQC